ETVWARLKELRNQRRPAPPRADGAAGAQERQAVAAKVEEELLQVLLADPALVPVAATEVAPEHVEHPGLRRLLAGLYAIRDEGLTPDLDLLRARLDNPRLVEFALDAQEKGRRNPDRPA